MGVGEGRGCLHKPRRGSGDRRDVWPHAAVLPLPWDWRLRAVAWAVVINREMLMHQRVKKHTRNRRHRAPSPRPRRLLLPAGSWAPCGAAGGGSARTRAAHSQGPASCRTSPGVGFRLVALPLRVARTPGSGQKSLTQVAGAAGPISAVGGGDAAGNLTGSPPGLRGTRDSQGRGHDAGEGHLWGQEAGTPRSQH